MTVKPIIIRSGQNVDASSPHNLEHVNKKTKLVFRITEGGDTRVSWTQLDTEVWKGCWKLHRVNEDVSGLTFAEWGPVSLYAKTGLLTDLLAGKQGWKCPVALLATCCGSKSLKVILIDSDFRVYPVLNPLVTL